MLQPVAAQISPVSQAVDVRRLGSHVSPDPGTGAHVPQRVAATTPQNPDWHWASYSQPAAFARLPRDTHDGGRIVSKSRQLWLCIAFAHKVISAGVSADPAAPN